jgi:hypothetical protein
LPLQVTSNFFEGTLTVFDLSAPGYPEVAVIGGRGDGPLEFGIAGGSGALCFRPGPAPTLLVAEHENDRVQEVNVLTHKHVAFLFAGALSGPRGVAASEAYIAVSAWKHYGEGQHVVALFSATTLALVHRIGGEVRAGRRAVRGGNGVAVVGWCEGRSTRFVRVQWVRRLAVCVSVCVCMFAARGSGVGWAGWWG